MRMTLEVRAAVGVLVCGMFAVGCSQTPTAPSQSAAMASTTGGAQALGLDQAPGLSLEHLAASGWDCRPAPFNPTRTTCSHPNQPHPLTFSGPPPPPDRPASVTLRVFDTGVINEPGAVTVRGNTMTFERQVNENGKLRVIRNEIVVTKPGEWSQHVTFDLDGKRVREITLTQRRVKPPSQLQ